MRAVFGDGPRQPAQVGERQVVFETGKLVQTKNGPVLIASGTTLSAAHPDPGYLGLWYLDRQKDGFKVRSAFPGMIAAGNFGKPPEWALRDDLGRDPVIVADGFGQWHGHAFDCATLVALGPTRPRFLAPPILTGYHFNAGPDPAETEKSESIEGSIRLNRSGEAMTVTYTGTTKAMVQYRRFKNRFVAPRLPSKLNRCSRQA